MSLRILGSQLWIGHILISEGLTGAAYTTKLKELEEIAQLIKEAYDRGFEDGETAGYRTGHEEGYVEGLGPLE